MEKQREIYGKGIDNVEAVASEAPVLVDIREGVAVVTLNRPERMNAWTLEMSSLYFDALASLAVDAEVRAILITGAGRAFCAGGDMDTLVDVASNGVSASTNVKPYWFTLSIGKPVIAAVRGPCVGVGFQQALCCDVRFVADDARIGAPYARFGMIGELGITWTLPRIVGTGAAMDLMLSGRLIGAEEAVRIGFSSSVTPADELFDRAFDYCQALAGKCSPFAMRAIKQQLYADLMSDLPAAYTRADRFLQQALACEDFAEGVAAFNEKRRPRFSGLDPALSIADPTGSGPAE